MHETVSDVLIDYLHQLGVAYVFGIPGGAIEPLFDALARSERQDKTRAVVARHESGAAFMADGYARATGRLGVCCATTGPGATNMLTGVASAFENRIPMLVVTAQTALKNHGRRSFQESAETGVNVIGMMRHCTAYNTMISHVEQFETKLVSAIMIALNESLPTHISIPVDVLRSPLLNKIGCNFSALVPLPQTAHHRSLRQLLELLTPSVKVAIVVGSKCESAIGLICKFAHRINADLVVTPDGKGLVNPYHPCYRGVIGFAGHDSARASLENPELELVIAAGTVFSEWSSNGWDNDTLLNRRLVHIDTHERNFTGSPMAQLHVRGDIASVFDYLLAHHVADSSVPTLTNKTSIDYDDYQEPDGDEWKKEYVPMPWLMRQLTNDFPSNTQYFADTGNSMAWAIHYLHPHDRRLAERRDSGDDKDRTDPGRRQATLGLFQTTIEFSSMGWAIGASIGAASTFPDHPLVCITGDGSWLMSGQETTTALQENIPVIFIILNDGALGMVKHGQRLAGAEQIGYALPRCDFAASVAAFGVPSFKVKTPEDWLALDKRALASIQGPVVIDVDIDAEAVPPIGMRMKVLNSNKPN